MSLPNQNLSEPTLAGRINELNTLHSKLNEVKHGRGTTVFLSGEAGSGKTRLSTEFLNSARRQGVTVFSGWCLSNASIPYFPFVEAFESYSSINETASNIGGGQVAAKTWLLGTNSTQNVTPQAWKDQTFAAVTKELLFHSSISPIILFIDDLHWADSASLALLHYISRSILSERIMVLATFRSEEVTTIGEDYPHPIIETLRLMSREDLYCEINLTNLDKPEIAQIIESMLHGEAHNSLIDKLASESAGLPLFIVESIRMLHEEGGLIQDQNQWRLGPVKYSIPTKVKDIILRRVESLKHSQRRVLEAASVVGELFDPLIVAEVVCQDNLDVLESLEAISQSTLLVHRQGEEYKFDHAKSREMLYDKIPFLMRKEYHQRIAQKLEQTVQEKPKALGDIAYHYLQAGNKEKSLKYSIEAGADALARFSNAEAVKHFVYVIQSVVDDPTQTSLKARALRGLGEAYFASSLFNDSMKTFEQIFKSQNAEGRLQAALRAMDSAFFQGNRVHLMELVKQAEPLVNEETLEWARVRMNRGRANSSIDTKKFLEDFEDAQKVFEKRYSLSDIARNLIGLAFAQMANGQMENAVASELRAVALFEELGDSRGLMDAYNRTGQVLGSCEMTREAQEAFDKAIQIGDKISDFNRLTEVYVSNSWLYEAKDDIEHALSKSEKALECSKKTDSNWNLGMTYSSLVRQHAKAGNISEAEFFLNQRRKVVYSGDMSGFAQPHAILFAEKGCVEEAKNAFQESINLLESNQNPSRKIRVYADYAWGLQKLGLSDEASFYLQASRKIRKTLERSFEYAELQCYLTSPEETEINTKFETRIEVVNVSKRPLSLMRIENLSLEFETEEKLGHSSIRNGVLDLKNEKLDPAKLKIIKLNLKSSKIFVAEIQPKIVFTDDRGKIRTCQIKPTQVRVSFPRPELKSNESNTIEVGETTIDLKSEASQKTLDFLINASVSDLRSRVPPERSGWRTLMDISKHTKVTKHSLYGGSGKHGKAILELESLSLIEARLFAGERGRGGEVLKLRAANENPLIKKRITRLLGK